MLTLPERLAGRALHLTGMRRAQVETSYGPLHYLRGRGRGQQPLVLLHGLSANAISYGDLVRRLRPHFGSLTLPDLPGHGYTPAPRGGLDTRILHDAAAEALAQLIDEPVVLVGNSMGGLGAVRFAAANPDKVRGLVLISPAGAPLDRDALDELLSIFRIDSHREGLAFCDRIFAHPPRGLRHAIAAGARARFAAKPMRELMASISPADLLSAPELAALTMPVLLIWGRQERVLSADQLRWFEAHLPAHAAVERWQDFGHIGFIERPHALARRIELFACELASRSAPAHEPAWLGRSPELERAYEHGLAPI